MKNYRSIFLLAAIICCWSCSRGGENEPIPIPTPKPEEKPKVEVTTTPPVIAKEGGTTNVTFTSSEAWTLEVTEGRAPSWCNVSPTSGNKGANTLTITTIANDTYDERNAKITIKAGTTTQSFIITQNQKEGLIVTPKKVEVNAEGRDITIEIKANVEYNYEIEKTAQPWISSNNSRGLTTKTLIFKVQANEKTESRQGYITIKGGEKLTEIITIYQEGKKQGESNGNNEVNVGIGSWENVN